LETIREYALEQLATAGEEAEVRHAHANYYAAFAERADLDGPAFPLTRPLEADHANLRAAMGLCRTTPDGGTRLLRFAAALGYFWFIQGYIEEGRAWCEAALARPEAADRPELRARVQFSMGLLAWDQGDLVGARALLEASAAGAQDTGDQRCRTRALYILGEVLWQLGNVEGARSVTEESVAYARAAGLTYELGVALHTLAMYAFRLGDLATARVRYDQSLAQFRRAGDPNGAAYVERQLGYVAQTEVRYEEARRHMTASLTLNRDGGSLRGVASCLAALAGLAVTQGQPALAARLSGGDGHHARAGGRRGAAPDGPRLPRARARCGTRRTWRGRVRRHVGRGTGPCPGRRGRAGAHPPG
jgi:tetratricopeptide (TPR) repeat protein